MIKTYSDSEIYVYCPSGVVTGGAELLHQLVSVLNDNGRNAYVVYIGNNPHTIPSDYSSYNIKLKEYDSLIDTDKNIEVIYEGRFDLAFKLKNTQKVLWWLSVDNFFKCSVGFLAIRDFLLFDSTYIFKAIKARLGRLKRGENPFKNNISIKRLRNLKALNAYQSEYAHDFLLRHGFREMLPLKDFINPEHGFCMGKKDNIILFNPKKGFKFTKKLIKSSPQFEWIPLQGMSRSQLIKTIRKAKLYVDFGNHPGKDRLPRECAANGCCIITGKRGSARYFEDVRIGEKFKFNDKASSIPCIIERIQEILDNYDKTINDFAFYRAEIQNEKAEFIKDALRIFKWE